MRSRLRFLAPLLLVLSASWLPRSANAEEPADKPPYDPTEIYVEQQLEGWRLMIHPDLLQDEDLGEPTLTLLRHQLFQITRVVEPPVLEKLRQVTIWVERLEPHHPCMAYHPDPGWLRRNDMNPDKARCVELANAQNFLRWTQAQPWMVLHELAHAYHHQFLEQGFDNPDVRAAYEKAIEEKRYDEVLHIRGRREKGYAATNPMEYFAETAEAWFGTNDFYPYVRSELKEHDPAAFAMHEKLWSAAGGVGE
jgi:hypothetical protein